MLQTVKTLFLGGVIFSSFSLNSMDDRIGLNNYPHDIVQHIAYYLDDAERPFLYPDIDETAEHTVQSLKNIAAYEKNKTGDFRLLMRVCKNTYNALQYTSKHKSTVPCSIISTFIGSEIMYQLSYAYRPDGVTIDYRFYLTDLSEVNKGFLLSLLYYDYQNILSEFNAVVGKSHITSKDFQNLIAPYILTTKTNEPKFYNALCCIAKYSNAIDFKKTEDEKGFVLNAFISDGKATSFVPLSLFVDTMKN